MCRLVLTFVGAGLVGVAAFEGPTRALFADYFAFGANSNIDQAAPALSNVMLAFGSASAVAFFVFPHVSVSAMAGSCVAFAAGGILATVAATQRKVQTDASHIASRTVVGYARPNRDSLVDDR